MNKAILVGNLGADPETRPVGDSQVSTFSVGLNWFGAEGKSGVDWIRVELWGHEKLLPYLKKGTRVAIDGANKIDKYENKDGVTVYAHKVRVNTIELVGSKSDNNDGGGSSPRVQDDVSDAPAASSSGEEEMPDWS